LVYADAISTPALLTRMSMVPAVALAAANWAAASCRVGSAEKTAAVQAPPAGSAAHRPGAGRSRRRPRPRRARRGLLGGHATRDGAVPGSC
jgi:hypothetical protein